MPNNNPGHTWSLAEKTGMTVLITAVLLLLYSPYLALIPLGAFLILCLAAPFSATRGYYLPIKSRGAKGAEGIALTFDDGPSPVTTPIVLAMLARYKLQATFFLVGQNAQQYPHLVKQILQEGHDIGNHSWAHDYFLMLRDSKTIARDIGRTQQTLRELGAEPIYFRPPVGVTGPHLKSILEREGLGAVTANCRAYDRGNRNIVQLAEKIINRITPGCIILLHDIPPVGDGALEQWKQELEKIFVHLHQSGQVVPLQQLLSPVKQTSLARQPVH